MTTRPMTWLDVETTGTNTRTDRVIELAIVVDGEPSVWRFNPTVPIPPEASAVHGISDVDVADCPTFAACVDEVRGHLINTDLGGYNIRRFDLPIIVAEVERAGLALPLDGVHIVDLYQVYAHLHPRTLGAAVRAYLGRDHEGAHSALADTLVLPEMLASMAASHDLPQDMAGLHALCDTVQPYLTPVDEWFDRSGVEPTFRRGKHSGRSLASVYASDLGYLRWMLRLDDLHPSVRDFIKERGSR